jgi:hypothetical protein
MRYAFGSGETPAPVLALPAGDDLAFTYARPTLDGLGTDVFYDRVRCATNRWDAYRLTYP